MKRKRTRKEPTELDRQVSRLLGERVSVRMRGQRSGHSRSLSGLCIAVDGHQLFEPDPAAHVIVVELRFVEDPPPPPPQSEAELELLREAASHIKCPLPPGAEPRKK
ncbi:MAG: hypothetical protein EPN53_01035 [Acidobacteria bacterium]|nr:MAG: hypothetical protein EPN53_01035 [Acidobacteriota bacterium]